MMSMSFLIMHVAMFIKCTRLTIIKQVPQEYSDTYGCTNGDRYDADDGTNVCQQENKYGNYCCSDNCIRCNFSILQTVFTCRFISFLKL